MKTDQQTMWPLEIWTGQKRTLRLTPPPSEHKIQETKILGELCIGGVARYCGLELKDGSPNNLLLAWASLWAPRGSQDAIERRLLLTHNIEPGLIQTKKFRKHTSLQLLHTEKKNTDGNFKRTNPTDFPPDREFPPRFKIRKRWRKDKRGEILRRRGGGGRRAAQAAGGSEHGGFG